MKSASVTRRLCADAWLAGARLDDLNIEHRNALIEAVVPGEGGARHQVVLPALSLAGADTGLTDRAGNTPLALAKAHVHGEDAAGCRRPLVRFHSAGTGYGRCRPAIRRKR